MKTKSLLLTLLMCVSLSFSFVVNAAKLSLKGEDTDTGSTGGTRKIKAKDVVVFYEEDDQALEVSFYGSEANMTITVANSADVVVYNRTVNTGSTPDLVINLATFAKGNYTVSFKKSDSDNTLSADFNID